VNTKRVIQYFATIAVTGEKKKEQEPGKMQVCHRLPLLVSAQDCACRAEKNNAYFWVVGLSKGRRSSVRRQSGCTVQAHLHSFTPAAWPPSL